MGVATLVKRPEVVNRILATVERHFRVLNSDPINISYDMGSEHIHPSKVWGGFPRPGCGEQIIPLSLGRSFKGKEPAIFSIPQIRLL